MTKVKKFMALAAMVGILGTTGAVLASSAKTPAEIVSGLTGTSVQDLYQERQSGKTYGAIARDAGKLDEFKAEMLEQRKAVLDQQVAEGKITQQRADEIYNTIKSNQAICDANGNGIGRANGICFGQGNGMGRGQGAGRGMGMHNGNGFGACGGVNR